VEHRRGPDQIGLAITVIVASVSPEAVEWSSDARLGLPRTKGSPA
jgi:hypothetical protein